MHRPLHHRWRDDNWGTWSTPDDSGTHQQTDNKYTTRALTDQCKHLNRMHATRETMSKESGLVLKINNATNINIIQKYIIYCLWFNGYFMSEPELSRLLLIFTFQVFFSPHESSRDITKLITSTLISLHQFFLCLTYSISMVVQRSMIWSDYHYMHILQVQTNTNTKPICNMPISLSEYPSKSSKWLYPNFNPTNSLRLALLSSLSI